MKPLEYINFYLTQPIYEELIKEHKWAKRIHDLNRRPIYILSWKCLCCTLTTTFQDPIVNTP